jgi:hypothetical protein
MGISRSGAMQVVAPSDIFAAYTALPRGIIGRAGTVISSSFNDNASHDHMSMNLTTVVGRSYFVVASISPFGNGQDGTVALVAGGTNIDSFFGNLETEEPKMILSDRYIATSTSTIFKVTTQRLSGASLYGIGTSSRLLVMDVGV